jgi:hypothetical protein
MMDAELDRVLRAADDSVGRLRAALSRPGRPGLSAARREVLAALAGLNDADDRIRELRRSVERARDDLDGRAEPLPADRDHADQLLERLADALASLDESRRRATEASRIAYSGQSPQGPTVPVSWPFDGAAEPRTAVRMGFAVDIVDYSPRPAPLKNEAQERLAGIVVRVLADLGLAAEEAARQDTGDGMNLFLPPEVELHRALPGLLRAWQHRVAADNDEHADRLRLRLAVGVGPVGSTPLGFSGNTIIEVSRLLDSDAIRTATWRHPERDLVVLVSDPLHRWVIGEGHDGLDAAAFERVEVSAKRFTATAWLWSP